MTNELSIAIVQTSLVWENIEANLSRFNHLIRGIKNQPHIIVIPEMFTTGFTMNVNHMAEPLGGRTVNWMLEIANQKNFAVAGSIIVEDDDKYYNRFLFVTPSGDIFQYDKRHLFSLGNEHLQFTKGTRRVVFEYLGWRILPQICYDLRFPVWSRNCNDYDLMINVANFPGSRRKVWNTLLLARALENQCYVLGANRIGSDGMDIDYTGDSQLINARGQIIAQLKPNEEGIIYGTFNLSELVEFRKKFPILPDADEFEIKV
jgi:omega-amidase